MSVIPSGYNPGVCVWTRRRGIGCSVATDNRPDADQASILTMSVARARNSRQEKSQASALFLNCSDDTLSAVRALGFSHFPKLLVRTLHKRLSIDHLSVVRIEHDIPEVVLAESAGRAPVAKYAAKIYQASLFCRKDPNIAIVRRLRRSSRSTLLSVVKASEIEDREHRSLIYRRFQLAERLAIIYHRPDSWYALNLYRSERAGVFTEAEIDTARRVANVLATLVTKHLSLSQATGEHQDGETQHSISRYEDLVRRVNDDLTTRQIQVCARALCGMTNQGIAIDLGIAIPTVATLRKRAYRRLNISSLNELFSLCLAHMAHERSARDDLRISAALLAPNRQSRTTQPICGTCGRG